MRIHDVAKKLKISVATVSRALNPLTEHLVAPKTRRRILKFVEDVGYVPNRTARELSTGRTKTIGVILPTVLESIFANDYMIKLLTGVYRVLEEHSDYDCKIVILPRAKSLAHLDQHLLASGIDGVLLSSYSDHQLYSAAYFPKNLLMKWRQPVVVLNQKLEANSRFSSVYFDQFEAARKAATYFIQRGHKTIAFIQGIPEFAESQQRYRGYERALLDHGLKLHKGLIKEGNFLIDSGYAATLSLFREKTPRPTAIFASNDEMAIGALRALRTLNIRCPQEIAVIGFDGIQLGAFVEPRLTSVIQPTREIAEKATKLLLNIIEKKVEGPVSVVVPTELVVRDSA